MKQSQTMARSQSMDTLKYLPIDDVKMRQTFSGTQTFTPLQYLKAEAKPEIRIGRNASETSTLENTPLNFGKSEGVSAPITNFQGSVSPFVLS